MTVPHLLIPFASANNEAATHTLSTLSLPNLEHLLARLAPGPRWGDDEYSLTPPHELALAALHGWTVADGLVPLAARQALRAGLAPTPGSGWALISPTHWHVGTEQFSLTDPAELRLDEAASRAVFDAVAPLFQDDGMRLHWWTPTQWLLQDDSLASLPTASLDRVIGRNVDLWLGPPEAARRWRRLQAEVQMLLHAHPLNTEREDQGLLPINSFWLSGSGPAPQASPEAPGLALDERLRAPMLAGDWAAWREAWQALDSGPVRQWLQQAQAGQALSLTLCGERSAQRFDTQQRAWWQGLWRPRRVAAAPTLESL